MFIVLLSNISNGSVTKCVLLSNQKCMINHVLNLHPNKCSYDLTTIHFRLN